MIAIAISGAPGAGKGTQSELLVDKYDFAYISTGAALRKEMADGTEIGKKIKSIMDNGELVSDDIVGEIIVNVVRKAEEAGKKGILFDGFPRTIKQAEMLDELLNKEGIDFDGMIGLEVGEDILMARILNRAKTSGRSDDNEESVRHRLDAYHEKTAPIFDYYKKDNRYFGVNGEGEVININKDICAIIDTFKI